MAASSDPSTQLAPVDTSVSLFDQSAGPINWRIWGIWLIMFGAFSMIIPRDASYDVAHYHLHNGWAFWHDRHGRDLAPAEMHTFLNPIWQIGIWSLAEVFPGRLIAFLLGMVQGLVLPALYALSRRVLIRTGARPTLLLVLGIAVAGFLSEAQFGLFGSVRNDAVSALIFLVSLSLLFPPEIGKAPDRKALLVSALLMGALFGMKVTNAVYLLGYAVCVLGVLSDWRTRLNGLFQCAAAGLATTLIFGGPWAWYLYQSYGNPIFPTLNSLFGAPLGPDTAFRDPTYLPKTFWEGLIKPALFLFDGKLIHEHDFFDPRFVMTWLGAPALSLGVWLRRQHLPDMAARQLVSLCAGLLVTIWIWTAVFSIGRYVIAIWMLGPVMVALNVAVWRPGFLKTRYASIGGLALCGMLLISTDPAELRRDPWDSWGEAYLEVSVPDAERFASAEIIFSGNYPSAMLAPGFPQTARFSHAAPQDWSAPALANYRPLIRKAWADNADQLYVVIVDVEDHFEETVIRLERIDGLIVDRASCEAIETNFDAPALVWKVCRAGLGPTVPQG